MNDARDVILLVGLGVLVLIGVFATELASETWDLVQAEITADEERRSQAGEENDASEDLVCTLQLPPQRLLPGVDVHKLIDMHAL